MKVILVLPENKLKHWHFDLSKRLSYVNDSLDMRKAQKSMHYLKNDRHIISAKRFEIDD